jgi:hypothetical protein
MRLYRILSLLILFSLLAILPSAATAQEPATVTLQLPASVSAAGETFTTDVTVSNATDLLGFQFDVNFDPARLAVEKIDLGPLLSSTGRSPQPLGPDMTNAGSGRVVYGGFTLGTPEQAGASGDGVLATITWKVVQPGEFGASLSRVQLAGAGGRALPGSDTPAPPATAAAQAEGQATATVSPAQPSPTAIAPEAAASEPQQAAGIPTWAIIGLIVVIIVVIALLLVRRRGSGSS